jgi:hypothetical protein
LIFITAVEILANRIRNDKQIRDFEIKLNGSNHSIKISQLADEKTNDYENFEKGMIYIKILKKGVVKKRREEETKSMPHAPVQKTDSSSR